MPATNVRGTRVTRHEERSLLSPYERNGAREHTTYTYGYNVNDLNAAAALMNSRLELNWLRESVFRQFLDEFPHSIVDHSVSVLIYEVILVIF